MAAAPGSQPPAAEAPAPGPAASAAPSATSYREELRRWQENAALSETQEQCLTELHTRRYVLAARALPKHLRDAPASSSAAAEALVIIIIVAASAALVSPASSAPPESAAWIPVAAPVVV